MTARISKRDTRAMRKPKDPEQTKADIIAAATEEFAIRGLGGARLDAVARKTRTTRAMVYYYFRSKERLYLAVLENAYSGIRNAEQQLDLARIAPVDSMCRLIAFTFDYYQANPHFVALVVAENQSGGKFIRKVRRMHRLNMPIIDAIADVLRLGALEGQFRKRIDPVAVHMMIAALGCFQITNRHTFGYLFDRDMTSPLYIQRMRGLVTEMVLRYLLAPAEAGGTLLNNGPNKSRPKTPLEGKLRSKA